MGVVAACDRPDLQDEAGSAFRVKWPEFIFHDPIAKQYVAPVAEYFTQYDVLLLDEGRVGAGGWGVPIAWDDTVADLPDGYDGAMARAVEAGLSHVIAPLRPTLKPRYPLTPMAKFAEWTRADGLSIDPWIRAHQRMGATILAPCPRSMVMTGTVAEWESWTDIVFPETGRYVVPEALSLVNINRAEDTGTYIEEGLWVQHL